MTHELIDPRADQIFHANLASYADEWQERQVKSEDNQWNDPQWYEIEWENAAVNYCASPIEQLLLAEMVFMSTGYGTWPLSVYAHNEPMEAPPEGICIAPQYPVHNYKLDFAVFCRGFTGDLLMLAIECDGHEWHKTKEQAKRDRKRDRTLQSLGWQTMRFTGSEIFADPDACSDEVGEIICDFYERGQPDGMKWMRRKWQKIGFEPPYLVQSTAA